MWFTQLVLMLNLSRSMLTKVRASSFSSPKMSALKAASPKYVACLVILLWTFLILVLARTHYNSDIRGLLIVGKHQPVAPVLASAPTSPSGYDGPMYAALATDPLLRYFDTPHYLDTPSYRSTRILVPFLAWVVSLGHASTAVLCYQVMCWGFALGAAVLLANWLSAQGSSAWWALVAAFGAGMVASLSRSTPDAGALLFALGALWSHDRRRTVVSVGLAAMAVLARETSVLVPLAIAVCELRRKRMLTASAFATIPLSVGIGWQLYLRHIFGDAFNLGSGNFSLPFAWLPLKFAQAFAGTSVHWDELFGTFAVLSTVAALMVIAWRPSQLQAPELALLGFGGMGLFLGSSVYIETWAYSRALVAVPLLAALVAGRQTSIWRAWAIRLPLIFYALTGLVMLRGLVGEALNGRSLLAAVVAGTPYGQSTPQAVSPPTTPSDESQSTATAQWVIPVASVRGRAGAMWKTQLEVDNPNAHPLSVEIDLFEGSGIRDDGSRVKRTIDANGRLESRDAVQDLFARQTMGALRVLAPGGQILVRGFTTNVAIPGQATGLWPATTQGLAVRRGGHAFFSRLVHDPVHEAGVRSNIGLLNLSNTAITIDIRAFDDQSRPLGRVRGRVHPFGFTQVDDMFAKLRSPRLSNGSAEVSTDTRGGAFLAYASVIRGPVSPPEYRYPSGE